MFLTCQYTSLLRNAKEIIVRATITNLSVQQVPRTSSAAFNLSSKLQLGSGEDINLNLTMFCFHFLLSVSKARFDINRDQANYV